VWNISPATFRALRARMQSNAAGQLAADRGCRAPPGELQRRRREQDPADHSRDERGAQAELAIEEQAHRRSRWL
jgi:hypothetical protein